MDRDQHQAWLAELAAEDRQRRAIAVPELARKEAALREARASLANSEAVIRELEAELYVERQPSDGPDVS